MAPIPDDVLEWFGDFRWWTRGDVFSHPQCADLVPSVAIAIEELRKVYDAESCQRMVLKGAGSLVVGLFLGNGFAPIVDELLQLGTDLSLCKGWEHRPKFLGALRSVRGWDGARFEAGVHAGLVRTGLAPIIEPAASKSDAAPDFVVDASGMRVALEVKGISGPDFEKNSSAVGDALGYLLWGQDHAWRGDATLHLSTEAVSRLEIQHEAFVSRELPRVREELRASRSKVRLNSTITLPTLGELVVAYPPAWAGPSYVGGCAVIPDAVEPSHLLRRALRTARECSKQLGAVDADLRVAVLWGGRRTLHAASAARAAEETISDEREEWERVPLDWIVFFNGHMLGPSGRWTIDIGICRISANSAPIPQQVLDGITQWGEGRNR
jgi:hypothetical protein